MGSADVDVAQSESPCALRASPSECTEARPHVTEEPRVGRRPASAALRPSAMAERRASNAIAREQGRKPATGAWRWCSPQWGAALVCGLRAGAMIDQRRTVSLPRPTLCRTNILNGDATRRRKHDRAIRATCCREARWLYSNAFVGQLAHKQRALPSSGSHEIRLVPPTGVAVVDEHQVIALRRACPHTLPHPTTAHVLLLFDVVGRGNRRSRPPELTTLQVLAT